MSEADRTSPNAPAGRADREHAAHFENTPLAVVEWDRDFRVVRWNGQAERVFGWPAAEVVGKRPFDWRFVHDDDAVKVGHLFRGMTARSAPRNVLVNRNYTRAGAVVWCEWHNSVLLDDAGRIASTLSLVLDVTDRVASGEALARSEAGMRAALSSARMIAWEWDYTTGRGALSADFAAFFGLPPGDYTRSEAAYLAVHPDDRGAAAEAWRRSAETGEDLRMEYRGAVPGPDGRGRWFVVRGQILRGPDGAPLRVIAVTTDVTDRKRREAEQAALDRQLLDTQKWEALGVLAGGIAHDFNNILTVVLGNASLARRAAPAGGPLDGYLEQIEQASRRAADLCRQMLSYAGRGLAPTGRADLNALVRDSESFLEVMTARHARVRFDLAPDLPPLRADEDQVRQVLVNLAMNAGEAVSGGGEVTVRTGRTTVGPAEPPAAYHLPPEPGSFVVLEVSDTGSGMTPDVRARMFDPFFTTRFAGRGLGLAAVLGMVRTHRGAIRVTSAPGAGTTVRVLWPADGAATRTTSPSTTAVRQRVSTTPPAAPRNGEMALIVDDEMYVREVAASTLEDLGYVPLLAATGDAGVALFREHRDRVCVAVIDMVMPGLTGDKVLAAIRATDPALPAVIVSGYSDRLPASLGSVEDAGRTEFLQKPFRAEELAATVRRVVTARTGG